MNSPYWPNGYWHENYWYQKYWFGFAGKIVEIGKRFIAYLQREVRIGLTR